MLFFPVYRFPKDKNTYGIDQQFMWGHALLISPVLLQVRQYMEKCYQQLILRVFDTIQGHLVYLHLFLFISLETEVDTHMKEKSLVQAGFLNFYWDLLKFFC